MKLHWLLLLPLLLSCDRSSQLQQRDMLAFGTIVQITLWDVDQDKANRVFELARSRLQLLHHKWHPWKESGELAQINAALAKGEKAELDSTLIPVFNQALELSAKSDGLFNPMIGYLSNLWGFYEDDHNAVIPDEAQLAVWLDNIPDISDIDFEHNFMHSTNAALQFDFGAFMKGYAIDELTAEIKNMGIKNMIINAGGDLRAIGQRNERLWSIAIRHPRNNDVLATLETHDDESVFTSGDYERFFIQDGRRYHHILDPRTAYPATATVAVTVITDSAGTADAAATALFIAGPDNWQQTAADMNIKFVLLIDSSGIMHTTAAMAERITVNEKYATKVF